MRSLVSVPVLEEEDDLSVTFSDVAGQRQVEGRFRRSLTVGEALRQARSRMSLPDTTIDGEPVSYRAHIEEAQGTGRPLGNTELIGDAVAPGAHVVVQEEISAG